MIDLALIGLTRFLFGGYAYWRGIAPQPRQRIYFANHTSHLDTLLIWSALPRELRANAFPVAASDYWGGDNWRGRIARDVLGAVLVDRSGAGNQRKGGSLAPLRQKLQQGGSLIFFPEGTRGAGPLPGPFKSGLYRLATEFPQVELAPVYLKNPARALPKGALLPAPIACEAHFGPPLARIPRETQAEFLDRARAAILELAE